MTSALQNIIPPKPGHLGFLDGMRGAAILIVFLNHALGASFGINNLSWNGLIRDLHVPHTLLLLYPLLFGSAGVALFFSISGFCIHLSWRNSKASTWKSFFTRRFFRIYPPYLLALVIFSFLWPIHRLHFPTREGLIQFFSHLLLIHNLAESTYWGINGSFWSIAVEWQLYLIYPLLLLMARRIGWKGSLIVTATLELGCRLAVGIHDSLSPDDPLPRLLTGSPFYFWFSWAAGAAVAEDYFSGRTSFFTKIPMPALVALIATSYLFRPVAQFVFPMAALAGARIIAGFCRKPSSVPVAAISPAGLLAALGIVSYSFYLLHQPILFLAERLLFETHAVAFLKPHPLLHFAIMLACIVPAGLCSLVFWKHVEQRSVMAGKNLVERMTPSMQTAFFPVRMQPPGS